MPREGHASVDPQCDHPSRSHWTRGRRRMMLYMYGPRSRGRAHEVQGSSHSSFVVLLLVHPQLPTTVRNSGLRCNGRTLASVVLTSHDLMSWAYSRIRGPGRLRAANRAGSSAHVCAPGSRLAPPPATAVRLRPHRLRPPPTPIVAQVARPGQPRAGLGAWLPAVSKPVSSCGVAVLLQYALLSWNARTKR